MSSAFYIYDAFADSLESAIERALCRYPGVITQAVLYCSKAARFSMLRSSCGHHPLLNTHGLLRVHNVDVFVVVSLGLQKGDAVLFSSDPHRNIKIKNFLGLES